MKTSAAKALLFLLAISTTAAANTLPVILQDTDLRDFVTWYTEQTSQAVIIAPGIKTSLTLYAPEVSRDALPELFQAVIRSHGLQLEPGNPQVITRPDPEQESDSDSTLPLVTQVHRFHQVLADDLLDFTTAFAQFQAQGKQATKLPSVHVIRSLNALALTTTTEQQQLYQELLTALDTPRPLILLEAVIYEVTDLQGLDLGLAYAQRRSEDARPITGFNLGQLNQLASTGFSLGLYDGDFLSFTLNALKTDVGSRILSTPQILVMSGEQGVISVGQNVPFLSSTTTGNGQTTQAIERRDVGVSLSVRPYVSQAGEIILGISLTADSINQSLQASDIVTNTRNLRTLVRLQTGQSITLGGLITENQEETVRRVPLLGSIPLLGALFRSTSTTTTQRELSVVLRATAIQAGLP